MKKKILLLGGLFSLVLIILFSCKIGLGSYVDTQVPVIKIDYPKVESVIRDNFGIGGTWSDDGEIVSVTVKLSNTEDNRLTFNYNASFDKKTGKWNCIVETLDYSISNKPKKIPDGNYEILVNIMDTFEHVTTVTRSITIDNTAPIIVLQKPSTILESNPSLQDFDTYGKILSIQGQAADDNDISLIEMEVYNDAACTDKQYVTSIYNVPSAINLDFSKHGDAIYNGIYGLDDSAGKKQFYCKINTYDGAQRYPTDGSPQSDDDKKGNRTDEYYIYNEIYSDVLKSNKLTDIYKELNGSKSSSALISLRGKEKNIGTFAVIPTNNPVYSVTGRESFKTIGAGAFSSDSASLLNGSVVVIELKPGLDNVAIPPVKIDAVTNKLLEPQIYLKEGKWSYDSTNGWTFTENGNRVEIGNVKKESNGSNVKISGVFSSPSNQTENSYMLCVDGKDVNNVPFVPENGEYGFHFTNNGSAPTIVLETPKTGTSYVKKGDSILVKGSATTVDISSAFKVSIELKDSKNQSVYFKDDVGVKSTGKIDFNETIPSSSINQTKTETYNLIVTAFTDKGATVERSIMYDIAGPKASIITMEPTAEKYKIVDNPLDDANEAGLTETEPYLNGEVQLKVSITDDEDVVYNSSDDESKRAYFEVLDNNGQQVDISYKVQGGATFTTSKKVYITTPSSQKFILDTTAFAKLSEGKKEITIKVHGFDRAGNENPQTNESCIKYFVDQKSDLPVILPSDSTKITFTKSSISSLDYANNTAKKNIIKMGSSFLIKMIDDDGLKKLTIRGKKVDSSIAGSDDNPLSSAFDSFGEFVADSDVSGTSSVYTLTPSGSGYYKYFIRLTDKNNNVSYAGPFDIYIAAAAPVITAVSSPEYISTATNNNLNTNQKFTNIITIKTSKEAPFKVYRKKFNEQWDYTSSSNQFVGTIPYDSSENYSFTDEISAGSVTGTTKFQYIVLDTNGSESNSVDIECKVDNNQPQGTLTALPGLDDTLTSMQKYVFQGTSSDAESKVKEVYLTIKDVTSGVQKTVKATGTENWVYALTYKGTDTTDDTSGNGKSWADVFANEGQKNVTVRVVDNAYNYKDIDTQTFWYDTKAPEITVDNLIENTINYYTNINSNKLKLTGSINEVNGLKTFTVKVGNNSPVNITLKADNTWEQEVQPDSGNITTLVFDVVDNANRSITKTYKVCNDITPPSIEITNPDKDLSGSDSISGAKYTFRFSVSDDASGVKEYKYLFTDTPISVPGGSTLEDEIIAMATAADSASKGWVSKTGDGCAVVYNLGQGTTPATPANDTIYEGEHYIYLYGEDTSGNKAGIQRKYWVDKNNPVLKETGVDSAGVTITAGQKLRFEGKVSDVNTIKSIKITDDITSSTWNVTLSGDCTSETDWDCEISCGTGSEQVIDGEHTFTITATDGADRETSLTRRVTVDTIAPSCSSIEVTTSPAFDDTTNLKKWFNKQTIGIKVKDVQDTLSTGANPYASEISTVQYSTDGEQSWIPMTKGTVNNGKADWTANVYCENQGLNTIKLQIKDIAGNCNASSLSETIYIDTVQPLNPTEYSVDGVSNYSQSKLINGRNNVNVSVSVADGSSSISSSGLKSITYKGLNNQTYTCQAADNGTYTFDILSSNLKEGSASFEIEDNVGNITTWSPFSLVIDNKSPEVSFVIPKDSDTTVLGTQINGFITLEGNAIDVGGSTIESIDVCYYLDAGLGWQNLQHFDNVSNWKIENIDTKALFGDSKDVTICVIASDSAGNRNLDTVSGSTVTDNTIFVSGSTTDRIPSVLPSAISTNNKITLKVDQDTDRPVIKFTGITFAQNPGDITWLKNQTRISGTISDDDGIKDGSFKISIEDSSDESKWKEISVDNGFWSFELTDLYTSDENGTAEQKANSAQTLYFKVEDSSGTKFKSKAANETCSTADWNTVYLYDGTKKLGTLKSDKVTIDSSSILNLTVDTLPPTVKITGAKILAADDYSTQMSALKLGGQNKEFFVKSEIEDSIGISNAIGTATFTSNVIVTGTQVQVPPTRSGEYIFKFTLTDADITELKKENSKLNVEVKITGEDTAGNKTSKTDNLSACFRPPVLTISAPDDTTCTSGNVTAYGSIDSTATMYYAISVDNTTVPGVDVNNPGNEIKTWKKDDGSTGGNSISVKPYFKPLNGNTAQWFIYFDKGITTSIATHDVLLKNYLTQYGITTENDINAKIFTDIAQLYLWLKAVDEYGNISIEKYGILVDPQGDAPKVTIDYPEKDGMTLGGTVTLRGSAIDTIGNNVGVKDVWVQIQNNVSGTTCNPTMNDVKLWIEKGYDVYVFTGNNRPKVNSVTGSNDPCGPYYIRATFSGSSWTLKINNQGEFNPATGSTNKISYNVIAEDNDGNLSKAVVRTSLFDYDNPVFSDFYLHQYSDNENGTGTITASRAYEDDMWIKGTWWLEGSVIDTDGISELTVDGVNQTITKVKDTPETFKYKLSSSGTDNVGEINIKVIAKDKADPTPHETSKDICIKYDNKAPSTTFTGAKNNINTSVKNSNGFYTFGTQVAENPVGNISQSGFDFVAFWFERNITGTNAKHVVYDIMRTKNSGSSEFAYSSFTSDTGLMWKQLSVTRSSSLGQLNLSSKEDFIHVGGLCKIGGSIYKITNISSDGLQININGLPEGKYTTAMFALANVVDNTIESGSGAKSTVDGKYGYYESVSNDDGDSMVESVQKSGTTWLWEANINSQNIPDGDAILHYVAFDKAGNYKEESVNVSIANNAPRLASLKVWSDYNENGTEQNGESSTYYFSSKKYLLNGNLVNRASDVTNELVVSGNNKDYKDNGSAFMTVKAATQLIPEIVGGNGNLYYSYKYGKSSTLDGATVAYGGSSIGTGRDDGIDEEIDSSGYLRVDENGLGYIDGNTTAKIELTGTQLETVGNSASSTDPTWFEYVIYDSTEGSSTTWSSTNHNTTGRLSAKFRVALNVQYTDLQPPTAWIVPFYWKNKSDNSVSWTSKGVAEGHIEFENDLPPALFNSTSGLYDKDPKVSGKIIVKGYAEDDIMLKELYISFANHSKLGTAQKVSTYDGTWSSTPYSDTNGWGFSAQDVYCDDRGHKVEWTLIVDTAKQTKVADTDKAFVVYAVDKRSPKQSVHTSTTQTTTDSTTCYYKVDVVPYVTEIVTSQRSNGGLKNTNIRSASGKYSIINGKTSNFITVNGFNFNNSTVKLVNSSTVNTNITTSSGTSVAATTVNSTQLTMTNQLSKSGYIEVFTNGLRTLNNINNNDSYGSFALTSTVSDYKDMPNREADFNKTKNVLLTDDRYILVFDMRSTGVKDGLYPVMLMNGDNPVFSYIDKNGGGKGKPTLTGEDNYAGDYQSTDAMQQRSEFSGDTLNANGNAKKIYTEYLAKALSSDQMGMARDDGGRYYNVSVYNLDGGSMSLIYDRYAELYPEGKGYGAGTTYQGYDGANAYDINNNAITLDKVKYNGVLGIDRYQNLKLISKGNSVTGNASVYLVYFDAITKEIIIRDFMIGKNLGDEITIPKVVEFKFGDDKNDMATDYENLDGKYVLYNGKSYKLTVYSKQYSKWYYVGKGTELDGKDLETFSSIIYDDAACTKYQTQKVSGKLYQGNSYEQKVNFVENKDNSSSYNTGRLTAVANGSKYFAFDVTSDNHIVLVYYDDSQSKLVLQYSTNAIDGSNPENTIDWTTSSIDLPEYVGNYVSMTLDSNDGIHIAAFDASDSDLGYIYIPSYTSTDYTHVTVDQFGSVGNWTQIKVDSNDVPYIAYANATEYGQRDAIKLAYARNSAGSVTAGVDSENSYTTGGWEYMTVPSLTPAQGSDSKFQNVCLDFDSKGKPVVGYLGECLEFGKWLDE